MTAQEFFSSLLSRGYELSLKGENVLVTGGEVTPELRDTLVRFKAELLPLLAPQQSFLNVRSKLTALEKQLGGQGPIPEPMWIVIHHRGGHTHNEAEVAEAQQRIWAAALAQYQRTQREDDLGVSVLHVGHDACAVCRELNTSPLPAQAVQQ
jgi:hypothetical protein